MTARSRSRRGAFPFAERQFFTAEEIAERFGVSTRTVARWRADGLPAYKIRAGAGSRPFLRFRLQEVERFIFINDKKK